jgi:formamidopyrimidine-DNA glycosylase
MPELPEVETSRRGISPYLVGERIDGVVIRDRRLRWPVGHEVEAHLNGATVTAVDRRAKYLLLSTTDGTAIVHLGMSGSVYIVDRDAPAGAHEHFDIELASGKSLRFRDPRRFGSLHWTEDPSRHWLLERLGPEPLGPAFDGEYLRDRARGRRIAIKPFIMDSAIVVGVGNIYANEALHLAGIHPRRAAGRISLARYATLAGAVREVLERAIRAGGTTLRDFHGGNGEAGYFRQELAVYDRAGEPCRKCAAPISMIVLGQRATYYCKHCQR